MAKANYDLPQDLLVQVCMLCGAKTKREAIILALSEYIRRKKLEKLALLAGKTKLSWSKRALRGYRG